MLGEADCGCWLEDVVKIMYNGPGNLTGFGSLFCLDKISLCVSGCPGTPYVDQTGLRLTKITCLCPESTGIKGVCHDFLTLTGIL